MPIGARAAPKRVPQLEKYDWVRELGRGAQGTVWLVRRKADRKLLAIKSVLLPPLACNEDKAILQRRQALREVEILKVLESPHLVGYFEAILAPASTDRPQSELHIVTEYCDGGDLSMHIRKNGGTHGFPESEVWNFATAILHGLRELHARSILHRDLKPANVFLKRNAAAAAGGQARSRAGRSVSRGRREGGSSASSELGVRVGDLGVAREMSESTPLASTMVGTPLYCAPEIFEGEPYGEKADVYSFGVCIYELMHGRPPFAAVQNMGALVRQVLNLDGKADDVRLPMDRRYSQKLRNFVGSCLALSPKERPAVTELLEGVTVVQVAIPCNVEKLFACAEPAEASPASVGKHLVRHSSQPRVALARSPSMKPALARSPSLPAARAKAQSPRGSPRPSVASPARRQGSPAGHAGAKSPRGNFSFQPPCRKPVENVRAEMAPAPIKADMTIDSRLDALDSNMAQVAVLAAAVASSHAEPVQGDVEQAERFSAAAPAGVAPQITSTAAIELPEQSSDIPAASHTGELLQQSLSSASLHTEERTVDSVSTHGAAEPDITLKADVKARGKGKGQGPSTAVASSSSAQLAEAVACSDKDADSTLAKPRTCEQSMTFTSRSLDVTPTAIAIEMDSSCEGPLENEMGDTRMALSPAAAKPCLVPALPAFSPLPRPTSAAGPSARSNQPGTPSSVSSRISARNSPQCPGGRAGLQQRSKGFVVKAQECWSRWRREKVEARKSEVKVGAQSAKSALIGKKPFVEQQSEVTESGNFLEIRGVAPPCTPPVSKRAARGSLAAARVLYTPPTRRAKGTRL